MSQILMKSALNLFLKAEKRIQRRSSKQSQKIVAFVNKIKMYNSWTPIKRFRRNSMLCEAKAINIMTNMNLGCITPQILSKLKKTGHWEAHNGYVVNLYGHISSTTRLLIQLAT